MITVDEDQGDVAQLLVVNLCRWTIEHLHIRQVASALTEGLRIGFFRLPFRTHRARSGAIAGIDLRAGQSAGKFQCRLAIGAADLQGMTARIRPGLGSS
jgi:hypothetical protein